MGSTNRVLILGNGISRLQYINEINEYQLSPGEIWGCNHIYAEYGHILTRINGHANVVLQAQHWKEIHGYDYRVITSEDYTELPEQLRGNSGIFLISQALQDGFDEIILCGFDFGGKDVWTPDMHKRGVTNGLYKKWDLMMEHFGSISARIKFWGIKPGYDKLSEEYLSIFHNESEHVKELQKALYEISGMDVIAPPFKQVTEAMRTRDFYKELLRVPRDD